MKQTTLFLYYVIALFIVTLCLRMLLINYYDSSLGGIEQNVVYGIQRILLRQPLYQDPSAGSYAIMQYTPLWYFFVAGIARLINHDNYAYALDVQGLYVLCRTCALVFNLLTILLCVLILRKWKISWQAAFTFALPVLMVLTAHYYTRGDSMHLMLFVAVMYFYISYIKGYNVRHLVLAALCSALCIMTKQSGILSAIIVATGLLFVQRRYLHTLIFITVIAVFAGLIVLLFNNGNGYAFYQNTVLGLKNGMDVSFLYRMFISQYFLDMVPCYLLAAILLFYALKRHSDVTCRALVVGTACAWLFAVVTGLKVGSSNNYFTEFLVLLLISLPYILSNEWAAKPVLSVFRNKVSIATLSYVTVFVLITSKTSGLVTAVLSKSFNNNKQEYARDMALYQYFREELHITRRTQIFFTERRYLDNIFVNYSIMPTKDVVTQVYNACSTTFDYSRFMDGMNSGVIRYIVTDEKRDDVNVCNDSLPFVFFNKDNFRCIAHVAGYSIYAWSPVASKV